MKPVQRCTTAVLIAALAAAVGGPAAALADGPADNVPGAVRPIPPPGIELDEATSSRATSFFSLEISFWSSPSCFAIFG